MTPADILQASRDAALPDGALAAALFAAPSPSRPRVARVRLRVKAWKPAGIILRMAGVMVARRRVTGCCSENDLLAAGFSPREIAAQGPTALAVAARQWGSAARAA